MAYFDHTEDFSVKMTKCRSMCTPCYTRSGRQIPPGVPQQAAPGTPSSSDSARELLAVFSTVMVLSVLQEIMTEMVF